MLSFFPPPVMGAVTFLLFFLNTVFWCIPLYLVILAKVLIPHAGFRRQCTRLLFAIAQIWSSCLGGILARVQRIDWDVAGLEGLHPERSYLLSANHQSWTDIIVLQYVFDRRIPFPRYFAKRELIWVPLIGGALWALEFPLMKRYSKKLLKKHPELRGQDLETTRNACERYRHTPVTIINFIEGTRFRPHKHATQKSPYRHLLRPKAGGVAFVLDSMGESFASMLDVTIIYPDGASGFWALLCGRITRVIVRLQQRPIPKELLNGNYINDARHRKRIQSWVRTLWQEKDELIERILRNEYSSRISEAP